MVVPCEKESAAAHVAGTLAVGEYRAGCRREDRLNWVDRGQQGGVRICMVGDGINDAPALKRAFVGIAMGAWAVISPWTPPTSFWSMTG